jgi:hypothetical protein
VVRIVVDFGGVSVGDFAFRNGLFDDAGLIVVREGIVMRWFVMKRFVRGFFAANLMGVLFFVLM